MQNQDFAKRYKHLNKALDVLGVSVQGVGNNATPRTLRAFIKKNALPPVLNALVIYGEAEDAIRAHRPSHRRRISMVTPRIIIPHLQLSVEFPILPFITGEIDDPFMISRRQCTYLMLAYKPRAGAITMIEVADAASLRALKREKPLEEILQAASDVPRVIDLLRSLDKLEAIEWMKPSLRTSAPSEG